MAAAHRSTGATRTLLYVDKSERDVHDTRRTLSILREGCIEREGGVREGEKSKSNTEIYTDGKRSYEDAEREANNTRGEKPILLKRRVEEETSLDSRDATYKKRERTSKE